MIIASTTSAHAITTRSADAGFIPPAPGIRSQPVRPPAAAPGSSSSNATPVARRPRSRTTSSHTASTVLRPAGRSQSPTNTAEVARSRSRCGLPVPADLGLATSQDHAQVCVVRFLPVALDVLVDCPERCVAAPRPGAEQPGRTGCPWSRNHDRAQRRHFRHCQQQRLVVVEPIAIEIAVNSRQRIAVTPLSAIRRVANPDSVANRDR
jgi:hypothetical protein